jgi:hypothetical protein
MVWNKETLMVNPRHLIASIALIHAIVFLIVFETYAKTWNVMKYNSMRVAYYPWGEALGTGKVDDFLLRVKNNGYNYLQSEFHFSFKGDATDSRGFSVRATSKSIGDKKDDFKNAFIKTDSFGIRLVPEIQMGDCHAADWKFARDHWNNNIQMTRIQMNDSMGPVYGCHAFTDEPGGVDKTFVEYLQVILAAYTEAAVRYPLEFIHLGHDEPSAGTWLIMGNCKTGQATAANAGAFLCGNDISNWKVHRVLDTCSADINYLAANSVSPGTPTLAVQKLLVSEIFRRINQVQSVFGTRTKVVIHADMWDPQFYFQKYYLANDQMVTPSNGICDLPGLKNGEKEKFRKNIILMPWVWEQCQGPSTSMKIVKYNPDITFSRFSKKGFKFIWMHTITEGSTNAAQSQSYYKTSLKYTSNCLGYAAASWNAPYIDRETKAPYRCYDILESLHNLNTVLPSIDFN